MLINKVCPTCGAKVKKLIQMNEKVFEFDEGISKKISTLTVFVYSTATASSNRK